MNEWMYVCKLDTVNQPCEKLEAYPCEKIVTTNLTGPIHLQKEAMFFELFLYIVKPISK